MRWCRCVYVDVGELSDVATVGGMVAVDMGSDVCLPVLSGSCVACLVLVR